VSRRQRTGTVLARAWPRRDSRDVNEAPCTSSGK
jgi:hypothetical protein